MHLWRTLKKPLGFIVSNREIEANPEKINAIMAMDSPATIKDVQKLTGCMAALNRFLSKLGERGLLLALLKYPFYPVFNFDNDMNLL